MRLRSTAFTLVELLVVVSVIALLIGILLPALGASRDAARQVQCLANLSSIGKAVASYTTDHRGSFPRNSHSTGNQNSPDAWLQSLAPYGLIEDARKCPGDPNRQATSRRTSYALTEYIDPLVADYDYDSVTGTSLIRGKAYPTIQSVPRPPDTLLAVEAKDGPGTIDHLHSAEWTSASQMTSEIAVLRHRGAANYLYMDGHAKNIAYDVFLQKFTNVSNHPFNPETARGF